MNVVTVNVDPKLKALLKKQFDIKQPIEKALLQSWLLIQNSAKDYAPYQSGKLRQSITMDTSNIKQLNVIIWSPLVYAQRRNYENKKNPHTLNYLVTRSYDDNKGEIEDIIQKALQDYFW